MYRHSVQLVLSVVIMVVVAVPGYYSAFPDLHLPEEEGNMMEVRLAEDCPCLDPSLCQSLGEAKLLNRAAPHVKLYEEKKDKPEVSVGILTEWLVSIKDKPV